MADNMTLAQYRQRWWVHVPTGSQHGPDGPWAAIMIGDPETWEGTWHLFAATVEDAPQIVAEHNATLASASASAGEATATEADDEPPGFDEPLGAPASHAELAASFRRRQMAETQAAEVARLRAALEEVHRYALCVVGAAEAYREEDCAHMWNEVAVIAEAALWPLSPAPEDGGQDD